MERMVEGTDPQDLFLRGSSVSVNRGTDQNPQPPLEFNSIHGEYVKLNSNGRTARREHSFCKGVVFSNRPILVNEIVCVRLSEVSAQWSGVMRFGVTSVDPASFRDIELPKFACPDLTSKGGFWCKTLPERFSVQGKVLHFSVDGDGNLSYGVNAENQGVFISKINVRGQIWAMFDLYGNCKSLELMDFARINQVDLPDIRSSSSDEELEPAVENLHASDLKFHRRHSGNVVLTRNNSIATRIGADFCQAYVFSHRPVNPEEKVSLLIQKHESEFGGSMAFGLTSCDPDSITNVDELPRDSDMLLDRKEYWTCIKNVAVNPKANETATFWVTATGEVMFSKNGYEPRTIMFVDTSIPLWMFFDLYGSTVKVKLTDFSEISLRPLVPLSQSPVELNVITPPRRSSSSELSRLNNLANEYGVRVQLPEDEHLTVSSAPTSTRRSPLSGREQNSSDDSVLRDINSRLNAIRDRNRRLTGIQVDMDQLRNQLAEARTIPEQSDSESDDERRRRRREMADNARTIARLEATLAANREELTRLSSILPQGTSRTEPRDSSVNRRFRAAPYTEERASNVIPPLRVPSYERPDVLSTTPPSTRSVLDRIRDMSNAMANDVPTTSSSTVTAPAAVSMASEPIKKPSPEPGASEEKIQDGGMNSECVVCMSDRVNAVLYRCGHLCMCFSCAQETMKTTRNCPLCRQMIYDVIRCYQS
uniref:Protein neuralized n=1 Tax=Bursaphelenchus xylophilus TaxID=6326 RepID=A0A1I7SQZ6_BURXY